jgi:Glycolipid transfer protein (GLTP)
LQNPSLQQIVEKEMELGVTDFNAEKPVKGRKFKEPWEAKYTSSARTLLRNMWLLDFVSLLFKLVFDNREAALSSCAKDAYAATLGNHHPWVVR